MWRCGSAHACHFRWCPLWSTERLLTTPASTPQHQVGKTPHAQHRRLCGRALQTCSHAYVVAACSCNQYQLQTQLVHQWLHRLMVRETDIAFKEKASNFGKLPRNPEAHHQQPFFWQRVPLNLGSHGPTKYLGRSNPQRTICQRPASYISNKLCTIYVSMVGFFTVD